MVLHKFTTFPLLFFTVFIGASERSFRGGGHSAEERPFNIFLDEPPTLHETFGCVLQTLVTGEYHGYSPERRARSSMHHTREYTLDDLNAGRSLHGIDMRTLPRQQQWDLAKKHQEFTRLVEHLDIHHMQLERSRIMDYLSLRDISPRDRLYYTKMLQLWSSHANSPEVVETMEMMITRNEDEARSILTRFAILHMQGVISDRQLESIRLKYEERPEVKARKDRILASCDFVRTSMTCTTDIYNVDGMLRSEGITVPNFTTDINWSETTQYINASVAETALMVERHATLEWEQWGALNTQAIESVMHPLLAAYGTTRGATDALVRPIVDAAHSICNLLVESFAVNFGIDVDTPLHDALLEWIEDSRDLYERDPYQAGYNLGGTLMKTALPFIKGTSKPQTERIASYKKILSTCKNSRQASEQACTII